MDADAEFARQVATMIEAGYPALAHMTAGEFSAQVDPLLEQVHGLNDGGGDTDDIDANDRVPWLIVVSSLMIAAEDLVPLLRLPGGSTPGIVDRNHGGEPLAQFLPRPELDVPVAPAYLVVGVDRGDEFRGVRPRDAVPTILDRGRTPLTIHEGLAFAMLHPASLEPNHCYMLAGSRRGDQRVPALWISGRSPKLGWCWDGNLHTWLGIASAKERLTPEGEPRESA